MICSLEVRFGKQAFLVTRRGRLMAAVISIEDYHRLLKLEKPAQGPPPLEEWDRRSMIKALEEELGL